METDSLPTTNNNATEPQQAGEIKSIESKNEKSKKRNKQKEGSGSKKAKTSSSENKDKQKNANVQSPKKKRKSESENGEETKTRSPKKERGILPFSVHMQDDSLDRHELERRNICMGKDAHISLVARQGTVFHLYCKI